MKMRPEAQRSLGVKIFAALTAGTVITAGVVHPKSLLTEREYREKLQEYGHGSFVAKMGAEACLLYTS